MQGKVIYAGKTKDGKELVIRYPQESDAPTILEYINTLSAEKSFILYQGEVLTLEKEIKFLETFFEKMTKNEAVLLLVIMDNKQVGISDISLNGKAENHVGTLGISLAKEVRGMGIGKLLLDLIIKEAIDNIPELKILTLGVFANNPIAIEMYRKFGFIEYGRLPEGLLHRGVFVDHIFMYKKVK